MHEVGWEHFQGLHWKKRHKSFSLLSFISPFSSFYHHLRPHDSKKKTKNAPKPPNPSHCPEENNCVSCLFYLALECMSFHNTRRNWSNKQLPTARRKPIPSRSSLPALTFYGSNLVHQEQFFPCPSVI